MTEVLRDTTAPDDPTDTGAPLDDPDGSGPQGRRWAPLAAAAVALIVVLLVGVLATRKPAEERDLQSPLVGRRVPALAGTTITGDRFDIDAQRGRYVLVNFFASWCVPCKLEHPELRDFERRHQAAGDASVVSIAFQDDEANIRQFFREQGGEWPVLAGDTGPAVLDFGIVKLPESYLVAPNGVVVAKFTGVQAAAVDDVIRQVEAANGSSGPGSTR